MQLSIEEKKLKALVKETIEEVLEERKETLRETITEIIEDIGLSNAIREGEATKPVSKEEIDEILERKT